MAFTPEETEALEALTKVFGSPDITLANISEHNNYHEWTRNSLEAAVTYYAYAKLKDSTDWEEIRRLQREEYNRKLAEREEGVRLSIMTGIVTSLLSKISKSLPEGRVAFDSTDDNLSIIAFNADRESVLVVTYNKGSLDLNISVAGKDYLEDATYVTGSKPPRQQFKGIEAVHVYLDGLLGGS